MEKFLQRRISLENLGDSFLDDAIIKELTREYIERVGLLLQEKAHESLIFNQGYIACLESIIRKMRQIKTRELAKEEDNSD